MRGIAQAIFVGTSLGGLVTMAMASMAPDRIAAAILNDVGPELDQVGLDRIQAYVGKGEQFGSWEDAGAAIAANQAGAFPRLWRRRLDRHGPAQLPRARRGDPLRLRSRDRRCFQDAGPRPKIDMWPLFAALAQKPLLDASRRAKRVAQRTSVREDEAGRARRALRGRPRVGHAPMLDEPEAAAAIDAFLDSLAES